MYSLLAVINEQDTLKFKEIVMKYLKCGYIEMDQEFELKLTRTQTAYCLYNSKSFSVQNTCEKKKGGKCGGQHISKRGSISGVNVIWKTIPTVYGPWHGRHIKLYGKANITRKAPLIMM